MRRTYTGTVLLAAALLAGCGPDWQPSWNMSSNPAVEGDSLTVMRVTGQDAQFTPLQSEHLPELRQAVTAALNRAPESPTAAMEGIPEYRPVPRPDLDAVTRRRPGSSTPPDAIAVPDRAPTPAPARAVPPVLPPATQRVEGTQVQIPGQPPGTVTGGTDRVQTFSQPGSAAGGVAVRDGGTTTVIQPGGRVTTIPTPR
ncbi:hypothetical protein [Roseomonas alba]|nr:hypothetical protein [Neoroseomonas alba]